MLRTFFFFSSRRRHTRCGRDWSSDVCSSDLRGGRELVRLADDERLERVAFVERRGRDGRGGGDTPARALARGDEEIHLRAALPIFLHAKDDRRRPAEHALRDASEQRRVLRLVPFGGELIGGTENQPALIQRDRLGWLEPCAHRRLGKFTSSFVEEALPSFVDRLLHLRFLRFWKGVQQGRPESTGPMWKSQP